MPKCYLIGLFACSKAQELTISIIATLGFGRNYPRLLVQLEAFVSAAQRLSAAACSCFSVFYVIQVHAVRVIALASASLPSCCLSTLTGGRAFMAIRDDNSAAEAMGNLAHHKRHGVYHFPRSLPGYPARRWP